MLSRSWSKAPRRFLRPLVRNSSQEIRELDHGLE